jgi:hypothetical protein
MKKSFLIILFLFVGIIENNAQTWDWAKNIQSANDQYVSEMLNDPSGNIYLSFRANANGIFESFPVDSGTFIAKFSPSGTVLWVKNYPGLSKMKFDRNGFLNITGTFIGSFTIDSHTAISNGGSDIYFMKLNSTGIVTSLKTFGSIGDDSGNALAIDLDNDIYLTGKFSNTISFDGTLLIDSLGYGSFYIVSLDNFYNVKWAKRGNWNHYSGYSITTDNHKNAYVWGKSIDTCYYCNGGDFTARYDLNGNRNYLSSYPYSNCFYNIIETNDHENIYKLGACASTHSDDPSLYKYDSSMNLSWNQYLGDGYHFGLGAGLPFDPDNNIYLGGNIGSWAVHDSVMIDSTWLIIQGNNAALVAKMDSAGNFLWFLSAYGAQDESIRAISTDINRNIYVYGMYYNYPGPDTVTFGSHTLIGNAGTTKYFLAKINQSFTTTNQDIVKSENQIMIYPNPSVGQFTLQLNNEMQKNIQYGDMIFVFDPLGNCVLRQQFSNSSSQIIDISKMAKGIYFVEVETGNPSSPSFEGQRKRINKKIVLN